MNRDDIIRMFHEAGETTGWKPGVGNPLVINYLTHFADLVAAAEREKCAKVCDINARGWEKNPGNNPAAGFVASSNCAAAIRARSKE